uniref:Uncharacterized protein n=1 Tax=Rousettus aegyptiacus TaxID=9407 RepID=A0A7J8KAU4_ROUAE|nr:hypothetical protein HJG63_007868 [Rousettus aegyptiacus]
MAAGPGGWLAPAFGLRLLIASVLHVVSAFGAEFSSEACSDWILTVEDAVRKKHSSKPKSYMQELFLKSVDENWGGSLKSKLLSGVINPNCSEDYKSSMFVVRTLY